MAAAVLTGQTLHLLYSAHSLSHRCFFLTEWNCWNLELPPDNPHTGCKEQTRVISNFNLIYCLKYFTYPWSIFRKSIWKRAQRQQFCSKSHRVQCSALIWTGDECHFALTQLNWWERTYKQPHLHSCNFISGRMFDSKDDNLSHMNQQKAWLKCAAVARSKLADTNISWHANNNKSLQTHWWCLLSVSYGGMLFGTRLKRL